jgi:uncharacterized protein
VIYLDSSALYKLIRAEAESAALAAFIADQASMRWFTSELARAEVARTVRRLNQNLDDPGLLRSELDQAERLWAYIDLVPVNTSVLTASGAVEFPLLRTLDAIHLATASGVRTSVSAFVTYDKRLAAAAQDAGLPVTTPA